jgi:hypothetical protein
MAQLMADQLTPEEIGRRGQALYEERIRSEVEPGEQGRFVVIDVLTGDYEVADDDLTATRKALARNPKAVLYGVRIGSTVAYRIGRSTGNRAR